MAQSGELKTSVKMRIAIIAVAVLMLGSTVALYMGIVLGYNNNSATSDVKAEKEAELQRLYAEKEAELAARMSPKYFDTFAPYKSQVRSYNAADITEVKTKDLKVGTGAEVTEGFTQYMSYYIGWLSDETIFDSSLNSLDNPTALKIPLAGGQMIEGWNQGIIGMKVGGVREISMPAELAYRDQARGAIPANSPLKFIIMLVEPEEVEWTEQMDQLYNEVYGYARQ